MDPASARYFAEIIAQARAYFRQVQIIEEDHSPARSILRLMASYGRYRVFITEIVSTTARKYRYYVLNGDTVVAGFDNAADPRVLRLKYGRKRKEHLGELIPHLHLDDKTKLELTKEMTCADFIAWLQERWPKSLGMEQEDEIDPDDQW